MARIDVPTVRVSRRPHVSDLLAEAYSQGEAGGPSAFGWHLVSSYLTCPRKAFYSRVLGLRPLQPSKALDVGTLLHACLALHYRSGGTRTWEPLEVVQQKLPDLASEVRRLLEAYFSAYGEEEARTLDVRAVEYEAQGFIEGNYRGQPKIVPLTCRIDLIVRLKKAEEPIAPPGPVDDGVWLTDHKSSGSISRAYVSGYGLDGQLLQQAAVFRAAKLDQVFGPLRGFLVNVIGKTATVKLERIRVAYEERDVDRFLDEHFEPTYELYEKLHRDDDEQAHWPMRLSGCKTGFNTLCDFFDACESHGAMLETMYETKPGDHAMLPVFDEEPLVAPATTRIKPVRRAKRAADRTTKKRTMTAKRR